MVSQSEVVSCKIPSEGTNLGASLLGLAGDDDVTEDVAVLAVRRRSVLHRRRRARLLHGGHALQQTAPEAQRALVYDRLHAPAPPAHDEEATDPARAATIAGYTHCLL